MPPSRRRVLQSGVVALAVTVAGCGSGALERRESVESTTSVTDSDTTETLSSDSATTGESTTAPVGIDRSLPQGSVDLPDGPESRPERPGILTAEQVREYVKAFEYRWVYNRLYRDESTTVHARCGVDSVTEYGAGFRVVVWCSAYANTQSEEGTIHADYFRQYATYFVGPDSTVRREGKPNGDR